MKETEEVLNKKADSSNLEQEVEKTVKAKKTGKDTVVVACAIPMGVILEVNGKYIHLNGQPTSKIVGAHGQELPAGKYGLTEIPIEDWEALKKVNVNSPSFINGIIFAKEDKEEVLEEACEKSKKKLGFEQADPKAGKTSPKSEKD